VSIALVKGHVVQADDLVHAGWPLTPAVKRSLRRQATELKRVEASLAVPQPNMGMHACTGCGASFTSEAAFTFHQRRRRTKAYATECLNPRQMRSAGLREVKMNRWRGNPDIELWYIAELQKVGAFT